MDAPRRRRFGARGSWRGPTSGADHAAGRADAGVAADGAHRCLGGLAFADPYGTTICAASAVLQFSGRVANDEHAVVNKYAGHIRTVGCVAGLRLGLAAPGWLRAGRVAHPASAAGELIACTRITND